MTSAIIVAAGKGTRMGANIDKLFLPVAGRPVVAHTWSRFDSLDFIDELVIVVRAGMEEAFDDLAREYGFKKPYRLVQGGKERQDSVWNGLEGLALQSEVVAIQDAARPCTNAELIRATIDMARATGAAVASATGFRHHQTIRQRNHHYSTPGALPALGRADPAEFSSGNHTPSAGSSARERLERHRRHGCVRIDRPTRDSGSQFRAQSKSDSPGRCSLRGVASKSSLVLREPP